MKHAARTAAIWFGCLALLLGTSLTSLSADKIKIEKLDDLPRYTYKIDGQAVDWLDNDAAVMKLAAEVKKDLQKDLDMYEIEDKTTLQGYYADLGTIALLEGDYDTYLKFLEKRKKLEDKLATRLMTGLFTQAYIKAKRSGSGDFKANFRAELKKLVDALPYEECEADIKQSKGSSEILSRNLIAGLVESRIQPVLDQSGGEMSKDIATGLLSRAFMVRMYLPLKEEITAVYSEAIDAHKVEKPDIWAERDIALTPKDGKAPVILAVWDSGVDTDIFKNQLWMNTKETPNNNKDDDKNGYVDYVFGIAYTLHSDKTPDLLFPIGDVSKERPRLQSQMKGLEDITSGIDSPEAQDLKKLLSTLPQDSVKPFIEGISKYGNYCHGTHVAGITAKGNPFARILAARLTFDYHLIPEEPTIAQAKKDAKAIEEAIEYFKTQGVRAVNMSWGGSLAEVESALEANNAGGTPEERKVLARQIFEIVNKALYAAIESAPDILFITSAGNANNDVVFEEFYPSSYDLPNIMSVGAVDQAGDETNFTSFGKVDVYANGFEVLSYVPGGDELKLSGTSMSSPNTTNLAGKLLAVKPDLTPAQVRDLIIRGCDITHAGDREIKLMNPKKSMQLLAAMK
ncbi:S8 family serine peptidase [bacterium]|nr:S8 family serine peptidase [bacterium]